MEEVKKTKATKKKPSVSLEERLNKIEAEIVKLNQEKKEIAQKLLDEVKETPIVPLHQLNLIGRLGVEKAKKQLGDNWVE